jgi:hypothetical protein
LGFRFDSKILISLIKNLLDGKHEEQPLQWSGQQHLGQQYQQQPTDGVAPGYPEPTDESSASDTQSTAAEPAGLAATTTTSVQAWGILMNSPYHFLPG